MDYWRTEHVKNYDNETELLAKVLSFGDKRHEFTRKVSVHVCGSSCISAVLEILSTHTKGMLSTIINFVSYVFTLVLR